jgi:hypothetical protein
MTHSLKEWRYGYWSLFEYVFLLASVPDPARDLPPLAPFRNFLVCLQEQVVLQTL